MTCIIGLEEKGMTYIGADSAAIIGNSLERTKNPKVFINGQYMIGYTTSFRMGQILQFSELPENYFLTVDEEFMVNTFIEFIREEFKNRGFTRIENNVEQGGAFLVGIKGKLFEIDSDFQVQRYRSSIYAIGCGSEIARGAMAALSLYTPKERIKKALEIVARFNTGVCGPFMILEN